jgi:hypothetical protein
LPGRVGRQQHRQLIAKRHEGVDFFALIVRPFVEILEAPQATRITQPAKHVDKAAKPI